MYLPILLSTGWTIALTAIGCAVAGLVAGYFIARFVFKKELKKHPPINEKQIRAMLKQMGRNPSEKQVREVMRSMEQNAD